LGTATVISACPEHPDGALPPDKEDVASSSAASDDDSAEQADTQADPSAHDHDAQPDAAPHDTTSAGEAGTGGGGQPPMSPQVAPVTTAYAPRVRTYFVAADELDWDYAPDGSNVVMGRPFNDDERVFVAGNGDDRVGSVYRKAIYRAYTDETFSELAPRVEADGYLGIVGPIIHAVVGDTIKVVFRNHGTQPYSVHAHGVLYDKASEGAETDDGTTHDQKMDDMVEPGATYTYTWHVVERSGPGPADPSSIVWLYHSHFEDGIGDEYAGLVGAIVVSDAEHGTASGVASDVAREVVSLFMVDDENKSVLAEQNFTALAPAADVSDEEFAESNLMHNINGYVFGNGPRLRLIEDQAVRWYLLTLGTEVDLHTPHWHGVTVLDRGHRTDVVELLPASMRTVDLIPDNPGTWMFHCHVNDHIAAGMSTLFEVIGVPH
jgi:hephaestin